MIPKYNSEIIQDLDISILRIPPEKILSATCLGDNVEYKDERGWNWKGFQEVYKIERHLLLRAKKESKDELEFEEILNESTDYESIFPSPPFDSGVNSITVAISALGCAPVSSCRIHPYQNKNDFSPNVSAWSTEYEARKILGSAKGLEVAVRNCDIENHEGIIVYANDLITLLDFSDMLYRNHREK